MIDLELLNGKGVVIILDGMNNTLLILIRTIFSEYVTKGQHTGTSKSYLYILDY
jgi:hypothetical protein